MIEITNRKAAYFRRTADEREADELEYQRRYMAGLAIQRRVTQGNRKLKLISNIKTPVIRQRNQAK